MHGTGFSLRIASYNIRALKDDADAVAAVVRTVDPDVLLLQEVPRRPGSDYAISALARETGLLWSGRTRWLSGTGLMTGLRLLPGDSTDVRLPVGLHENPRGYTLTRVRRPGGPAITLASIHLPLRADQRRQHARTVLTELAAGAPEQGPVVVGGDLNEDSSGAAWRTFAGQLTAVTDDRLTYPAAGPRHRIDAIFARGHRSATPGDPQLLGGIDLARASDHLPVWVDLGF